jgi:hypothetical protein
LGYADFLKSLYPTSHDVNGEVYSVILGAIGNAIDQFDPNRINLKSEFSVTTAIGNALDSNGQDWSTPRRNGESDSSYRSRVLSLLPLYSHGPSVPGVSAVATPFTGAQPVIFEYGPEGFVMGESTIDDAGFTTETDVFTFELHVQNPNNLSYNHLDLENAVRKAKLARSTAIIFHNGIDTSTSVEQSNAIVTIV